MNEPKKDTPAASPDALLKAGKDAAFELTLEELDKVTAGAGTIPEDLSKAVKISFTSTTKDKIETY
jgi:hypothetical protein